MALVSKKILFNGIVNSSVNGEKETLNVRWKHYMGFCKVYDYISGTFNCLIQHSPDGTNWFDLITFSAISSNNSDLKQPSGNSFFGCLPYIRAKINTSGSPNAKVLIEFYYDEK